MSKTFIGTVILSTVLCLSIFSCFSCSSDDETPTINSVWLNMTTAPVQQVGYAYPGQTLCLHGSGFAGLQKIIVNDTEIEIISTLIYDTDNNITFQLPTDVNTSTDESRYYIKVVCSGGEAVYRPFIVKPTTEKPSITKLSTTVLVAGSRLTITGTNFDQVSDVYLPTTFDGKVRCEFDEENPNTSTELNVLAPADTHFAKGRVEVVMQKTDPITGNTYEEHVYSATTNFQ